MVAAVVPVALRVDVPFHHHPTVVVAEEGTTVTHLLVVVTTRPLAMEVAVAVIAMNLLPTAVVEAAVAVIASALLRLPVAVDVNLTMAVAATARLLLPDVRCLRLTTTRRAVLATAEAAKIRIPREGDTMTMLVTVVIA